MSDVTSEVRTLTDNIYYARKENDATLAAQTLIALVPTFTQGDKEFVLKNMNYCLSDKQQWKQRIASTVIVAVRHYA